MIRLQINDYFHKRRFVGGSRRSRRCLFKKSKPISNMTKLMFMSIPIWMNNPNSSKSWTQSVPSMKNNNESNNVPSKMNDIELIITFISHL